MRASTTNSMGCADSAASNPALLSPFDPFVFEFNDQVVLTFQTGNAVSTLSPTGVAANACAIGQPIEFRGWRLTLRGSPAEAPLFDCENHPHQQVPLVKFAADLTVHLINSSEATPSVPDGTGPQAGIFLDEQTLRFLQLQQSYQAAAQFLQIAQTRLDTLMQTLWVNNEEQP